MAMSRTLLQALSAVVLVFLITPAAYCENRMSINDVVTFDENWAWVELSFDLDSDITAWSVALCTDPSDLMVAREVIPSETIDTVDDGEPPFFQAIEFHSSGGPSDSGGVTISAIVSKLDDQTLAEGDGILVYEIRYFLEDREAYSFPVTGAVTFCTMDGDLDGDGTDDPTVENLFTIDGDVEVEPTLEDGEITWSNAFEYTLCAVSDGDDCDAHSYDPEATIEVIDIEVAVEQIDADPIETHGFEMSLPYDVEFMTAVAAEPAGVVADLNGGDGPDFFAEYFEAAGFRLGCIYSFTSLEGIDFSSKEAVMLLTFETEELEGEEDEQTTILEWGDIWVYGNVVVGDGASWGVRTVDLTLNLVPDSSPSFLRGDADGSGVVFSITDALYILAYGFTNGEIPPCLSAADVDDSGEVMAILDAVYLLNYGFTGGDEPPDPGPDSCGVDSTGDELGCETLADECA